MNSAGRNPYRLLDHLGLLKDYVSDADKISGV